MGPARLLACVLVLAGACARSAAAAEAADAIAAGAPPGRASSTEINKNVTDPISTTWSLQLENTVNGVDVQGLGNHIENTVTFQPTMPVLLTPGLKFISRPNFTLLDDKPFANSQGSLARTTGVGDTKVDFVLSPILGPWLFALGPTFVCPTANLEETGQGKWQAGPASVFGYRSKTWLAGVIEQQWWSFAGSPGRPAVSELHLQYIASYFFGDGWSIGTAPIIKVNWRASPGNGVTFPFGPALAKVVKIGGLPVKFEVRAMYVPVHPDTNGDQFQIQLLVTPVIRTLVPGPLFGG